MLQESRPLPAGDLVEDMIDCLVGENSSPHLRGLTYRQSPTYDGSA